MSGTEKLTVTVQAESIRKLDRLVSQGRYKNRSQATQAALDLLEQRNRLPTLAETLAAGPRPLAPEEQDAWEAELALIDTIGDANEPRPS
jgi:Arc/MetJ-type ribon-helix-helix transcriptional regulator